MMLYVKGVRYLYNAVRFFGAIKAFIDIILRGVQYFLAPSFLRLMIKGEVS